MMDFSELLALIATATADVQKASDALAVVASDLTSIELKAQAMSASQPGDGGGENPLQAQLDAALAQVAQLQAQVEQVMSDDAADKQAILDEKAKGEAAVADLQAKFDALAAKEGMEAAIVDGLKGSLAALQDVVAKLSAIQTPVPTPEPEPVPEPVPEPTPEPVPEVPAE